MRRATGWWMVGLWALLACAVLPRPALGQVPLPRVDFLEDRGGRLTLAQARAAAHAGRYLPDRDDALRRLGYTASAYWVRITVPAGSPLRYVEIARPHHGYVDFHRPRADGGFELAQAGARRAVSLREIDHRHPVFRLAGEAAAEREHFLRVASEGALALPLRFLTEHQFHRTVSRQQFEFGVYFGLLGVMVLYNVFLYFGVRDRAYLWYVLSTACFGFFMLSYHGLAAQWLWPHWQTPNIYPVMAAIALGVPAYLQFVRHLLGTAATPRIDRLLRHTAWLSLPVLAAAAAGAMRLAVYASNLLAMAAMAVSSLAGFVFWRRGFRPARYFVLAFLVLWLAVLVTMGRSIGYVIGSDLFIEHGMQVGSAIEVVLFAFALADRINLLKIEKERAQAEALRIQGEALAAARRSEGQLEQRVAERTEALARAVDEAQQANLAKTRFLAAASHDLRQPMHAIGLLVGALRERVGEAEARRLVDKIDGSVEAMDGLFSALLDISRLDSGSVVVRPAPLRLQALFDALEMSFGPQAQEKGLSLRLRASAALVRSDAVLLDRILRNLIANALRYTERGGVRVAARRRGAALRIEVWDSGPGIAAHQQALVFEEFVQLANPTRDRAKGLGLGLSIVRRLGGLLGHEIGLRSVPGRGSVFSVVVPYLGKAPDPAGDAAPPEATADLTGAFVLVIDDEPDILEGMCALLTPAGARVVCARSGPQAVAALAEHLRLPDLIISDYRIAPDQTGIDAIRLVRAAQQSDIPALLITGDSSAEDLRAVRDSGLPVMFKPVSAARVVGAVAAALAGGVAALAAVPDA